jgi:hypothetical protein
MIYLDLDLEKQLESLYDEIGERNPFKLAKHLGMKLSYNDFGDEICGVYKAVGQSKFYLMINSSTDLDTQETTCYLLVKHHKENTGIDTAIVKADLKKYNKLEREARRFLRIVSEIFTKKTKEVVSS